MSFWQWYVLAVGAGFLAGPILLRIALIWRQARRDPVRFEPFGTSYGFVQWMLVVSIAGFGAPMALFVFAPALYAQLPAFAFLQAEPLRQAGAVLSALGVIVMWLAQSRMGQSWRFGPDREETPPLVTEGIFRWVRNPIYLSMLLAGLGIFLMLPDAMVFAALVLGVATLNMLARLEEEFLAGVHGASYLDYKRRVGRFLPRLTVSPRP
ncbi:MAG: methyltransferase family protein [Candidatus Sericytochromatia bacterium]